MYIFEDLPDDLDTDEDLESAYQRQQERDQPKLLMEDYLSDPDWKCI